MADISAIKLPDGMTYNLVDKTSGYITNYTETDPIFSASAAHGISTADITNWNSKQAALVSGTNIKTINNQSILGSGNIDVDNIFIVDIGSSTYNDIYQAYIDGKTLFAKDSNRCIDSYEEYWLSFTNYNPSDDMITFSSILDGYEAWASIDIVDNWQYGRAIITPAWAKASTKPTYTASEVGALPASTVIPTNTSDLVNDSGFIDSSVLSVVATSGDYNDLSNKPTIPQDKVFIAEKDVTTYAEITAALNAGKTVFAKTSNSAGTFNLYRYALDNGTSYYFYRHHGSSQVNALAVDSTNTWSSSSTNLTDASNLTSGTLPVARLPVLFKTTTAKSSATSLNYNTGKTITVTAPAQSGYVLVGVVGVTTNHAFATSIGGFNVSSSKNRTINVAVTNRNPSASGNFTDLTVTVVCLWAISNII